MASEIITEDTELRHLRASVVYELGRLLNRRDDWKKVMSSVRVDCDPGKPLKYKQKDIETIADAGRVFAERGCTEIFLDEWGTSGRRRPKLNDLVMLLEQEELYQAAHYLRVDVLKQPAAACERMHQQHTIEDADIQRYTIEDAADCTELQPHIIPDAADRSPERKTGDLIVFSLCELERATNSFNREPYCRAGNKLGEGQFGAVYYGKLKNMEVAVKTLEKDVTLSMSEDSETTEVTTRLFENEVATLSQCKHPNLVRLVGFCKDIINCVVYEYMCNGSLYDRLSCLNNSAPLSSSTRYAIALGVAEALHYLHRGFRKTVVHRDVKSANVLLDAEFVPKLGDFGIVKMSEGRSPVTMYTESSAGTPPYMAPEAHHGAITTKSDVFSYGIVLLELLTGLKPYDEEKRTTLYYYLVVEEEMPVREVLDRKAGYWDAARVDVMVDLVWNKCCRHEKDKRAEMKDIVDILKSMLEE